MREAVTRYLCVLTAGLLMLQALDYALATGEYTWQLSFGGPMLSDNAIVWATATDSSRNVVIVGEMQGSVNFGGSTLVSAGPERDVFVARYSSAGAHLWSKRFGSTGTDVGYGVGVGSGGNDYVAGTFSGTVNFGGSPLVSAGNSDIFTAKYSSAGAHVWSKRIGGTGNDLADAIAQGHDASTPVTGDKLNPGDIVYTDSGNAIEGAFINRIDAVTGQETVISHGGYLGTWGYPIGVVFDRNGQLIVANEGCLLRIDPNTGEQNLIRDTRGAPGGFWSVALDHNGDVLVAAETAILRVDPFTGDMRVISSGGYLTVVLSVAAGEGADLFVTNVRYDAAYAGWVGEIIRVNRYNGRQTIISQGGYLNFLRGIAVDGNDIYVTGMATQNDNFGKGRVTHVDARTGFQRVVSQEENLICPVGIAVDENGQLIVADPYTINPQSPNLYDGGIITIDPTSGEQTLVARGHGGVLNPCGVAVVPAYH